MTDHAASLPSNAAGAADATGVADAPSVARRVAAVIRRIIGVPDYDAYVAHVRAHHPGQDVLSERDFHREQLAARYSRPGSRCC
ncbi:MAG: YbdD/YjiX family protein [Gemmatimonadaceae bacterium]